MYYAYILKSLKDKRLYIGFTSNLKIRFKEHCEGLVDSTKDRRPLELIYYEAYKEKGDAVKRELSLKKSGSVYMGLIKRIAKSLGV